MINETWERREPVSGGNTGRGLSNECMPDDQTYWYNLGFKNEDEFLIWLKGSTVLDVGSGYGALLLDIVKKKGNDFAKIINLNPTAHLPDFQKNLKCIVAGRYKLSEEEPSQARVLEDSIELVNKFTIPAVWPSEYVIRDDKGVEKGRKWTSFPLPDGSCNKIVACVSFPIYTRRGDLPMERQATKEEIRHVLIDMLRILKPGGEIRLGPIVREGEEVILKNAMGCIEREILDSLNVDYKINKLPADSDDRGLSFISIKKPFVEVKVI